MSRVRPPTPGNPFSTRHVRPGAVPFVFPPGVDAAALVERFRSLGWRAAVVGPHGSGKSTLLAALRPALRAAGREPWVVTLHDGRRSLPRPAWEELRRLPPGRAVLVDGYEQLGPWARLRLRALCRLRGHALLVTTHARVGLPTLWRTNVTPETARRVIAHLEPGKAPPDGDELRESLARHAGNFREVLFELYDRHERRRRAGPAG
jgi:hypothetical protein